MRVPARVARYPGRCHSLSAPSPAAASVILVRLALFVPHQPVTTSVRLTMHPSFVGWNRHTLHPQLEPHHTEQLVQNVYKIWRCYVPRVRLLTVGSALVPKTRVSRFNECT